MNLKIAICVLILLSTVLVFAQRQSTTIAFNDCVQRQSSIGMFGVTVIVAYGSSGAETYFTCQEMVTTTVSRKVSR